MIGNLSLDIRQRLNNLLAGLADGGGEHKSLPHEASAIKDIVDIAVQNRLVERKTVEIGNGDRILECVVLTLTAAGYDAFDSGSLLKY